MRPRVGVFFSEKKCQKAEKDMVKKVDQVISKMFL